MSEHAKPESVRLDEILMAVQKSVQSCDWKALAGHADYVTKSEIIGAEKKEFPTTIGEYAGIFARIQGLQVGTIRRMNPAPESAKTYPLIVAASLVTAYDPKDENTVAALEKIYSETVMRLVRVIYKAFVAPHKGPEDQQEAADNLLKALEETGFATKQAEER